jgi:hypothetical protein
MRSRLSVCWMLPVAWRSLFSCDPNADRGLLQVL